VAIEPKAEDISALVCSISENFAEADGANLVALNDWRSFIASRPSPPFSSSAVSNCTADAACRVESEHKAPSIWLELIEDCNLDCAFCYNPWRPPQSPLRHRDTMGAEALKAVISMITDRFGPTHVTLSGGEPLMYRNLPKLTAYLAGLRHQVGMTTNGRSATRRRISDLRNRGLSHVSIPVHSPYGRVHDELTQARSWSAAVRALALCLEIGVSVTMSCVLTQRNIADVDGVAKIAGHLGIKRLALNAFHSTGQGLERADLTISAEEFAIALNKVRAVLPPSVDIVVGAPPESVRTTRTRASRIVISPYGDIKLCAQSVGGIMNFVSDETVRLEALLDVLASEDHSSYIARVDNCSCFGAESR
jgi:MoaA/NifB/PqqE/SkfB family radical SAM enzyme